MAVERDLLLDGTVLSQGGRLLQDGLDFRNTVWLHAMAHAR